jgi:glycine oxidase
VRDVVVVGAGLVGLACARALAERGRRVTAVESGAGSREASWAAAGILGVGSEFATDGPLARAAREAFRAWPDAVARLERETGVDVGWSDEGTLLVALDEAETSALAERARRLAEMGVGVRPLSREEARRVEPRLSPSVAGALRVGEARLDNRRLWDAYAASCRRRGVEIRTEEPATAIEGDAAGRVAGVRTARGTIPAGDVILAAGAWTETLARLAGIALPSSPVKGQMVRLDAPDGFLRHVVKRGLAYAVPRRGAGLVVGTTSEAAGFSRGTDDATVARLVSSCAALVPSLAALPVAERWSGLRPRLEDGLPAIGPVPSRPGLHLATGHFRTGVLLCEWTGRAVALAIDTGETAALAPFSPGRFAEVAA